MTPDERDDLTLAVFLVALAGFVDAVGFLTLGGLFVSFTSGNSTQFAIRAGQTAWAGAASAGGIVGLFVVGVVAGRLLGTGSGEWRRPAILALEAVLLALAAAIPPPAFAKGALMAVAMGAQNALFHAVGETQTSLTFVTGALVYFGEGIADAMTGAGSSSKAWPYFALWVGLFAGGAAGAAAHGTAGVHALALPAVATALLAAASVVKGARGGNRGR